MHYAEIVLKVAGDVLLPFEINVADGSGQSQYTVHTRDAISSDEATSCFDSGLLILSIWMMVPCQFFHVNFFQ